MSVVTLRPNATIVTTGVITTGSVAAHTVLSDNNDGTSALGTVNNGYTKMHLGTTTLGSSRVKQARIRIRDAHDAAGSGIQIGYATLYDTAGPGRAALMSMQRGSTAVATQTGPWDNAAPNGAIWTQARVDRLGIQVVFQGDSTTQFLRVHEAYVDLDLNSVPVTSAVTAANVTITTRPDISWTFTDADGDLQARYRVKIFTSTQYGAAGFDAATSTPTYDSGDLFGDVAVLTLPVDLVNGTTYKAFVKTAQDWPGPEGDLWWSTWVASSAFTIAVVPPITPTLTATPDLILPGYRMLFTATAPVNLATSEQAGLEGGTTTGWVALTNCTISNSTATAAEGTHSLQLSSTAAGTMAAEWSARVPVSPSTSYSGTAAARTAVSARTVSVGIRWYDQAGTIIGATVFGTGASDNTSTYTTVTVTATSPATAFTASIVVQAASTAAGAEVHRFDQIGLQVGTVATWATGGSQSTAAVVIERLLKVNSDRAAPGNWAHPQLASGSGLTRATDGFYARLSSRLSSRVLDSPHPAGITASGARMVVWHPLIGASNALDFGSPAGVSTDDPAPPYLMPGVPARAQTLSVYVRGSSAVGARVVVVPVDATNIQVGGGTEVASATVTLSTTLWTRYSATITPPTGACYLRGQVELPSSSVDLDIFVTGIQLELGSAVSAFVPGTGTLVPAWDTLRELESTAPVSPGERYIAWDHEMPPGDPVLYRARTVVDTLASAYTSPLALLMDPPARNLLKDPFNPENATILNVAPDWSEAQSSDTAIFHPLGRDRESNGTADPVQVRDWLGGQDASYVFATLSELELYRLRLLISSARPLLLQHFEGGQRYVLISEDRSTSRFAPGAFRVAVKTFTCARPS